MSDGNTVGERSIMAVCDLRSVIVVPRELGVAGFLPSFAVVAVGRVPRVLCARVSDGLLGGDGGACPGGGPVRRAQRAHLPF